MGKKASENASARASLELLYEIGREVAAALELQVVLERLLFLSMSNIGANSGSIIVIDEGGNPAESAFLIEGKPHDHESLQLRVTYERGLAGWVARNKQAVLVPDTSVDDRWLQRPDDAKERTGAKSAVSVPILAQEKLVGVITLVHPTPGFFTAHHLELIKAIGDQAGTAVRHAQLFNSLQSAHRRYRELFDDSVDPILITTFQGQIVEANRRAKQTVGLKNGDLLLTNILEMQDGAEEIIEDNLENLSNGETVIFETAFVSKTGYEFPAQVNVRGIEYESEAQLQWIIRDITERKNLDNLREDLIAMVYHDLRSPLTNIMSSLEVLLSMLEGHEEPAIRSLLNIAVRSTERIQRLTNSLLDINRLEAGQEIGSRDSVDLSRLLKDAILAVQPVIESKNLVISVDISLENPEILADEDMIRRVLINLIENAVKFTPSKKEVKISAEKDDGFIRIKVQDAGPGILAEDQERIFNKFVRINMAEGSQGLGLGLAFCRLAVLGHGGQIWVESDVGSGSKFCFTLPTAKETQLESDL